MHFYTRDIGELKGKTVRDLLNSLNLDWARHVVIRNGEIVTEDEKINDGDYIKILDAVSGG
ncbi:MAG: hypothetical protein BXU00_01850 [Candidatus Nanoclepta minutus]|uniref:Thiamine biosynthesis protein ThiS n=1 Tax=Candidatus Nanoclepta minutus TaxID=1940235 RepID=A0A397WNU7_9ARCH|nr:MAG: hypothetical protein BXU00_01850 [Candidatus Nanoclepta minutus]